MKDSSDELELIDRMYAVAMEPERFDELIEIWYTRLSQIDIEGFGKFPGTQAYLERHIKRAGTILSLVTTHEEALPRPLQEKLNSEPQAMIALSDEGIVKAFNPAAQALYHVDAGDKIGKVAAFAGAQDILAKEIRRISRLDDEDLQSKLSLFRIPGDDNTPQLLISFSGWMTSGGRRFVLLRTSQFTWPETLTPLFSQAFGLTEAETDVVRLIVEGASVEDVADLRGSTVTTVRSQIKSIYAKTGTRNQSEFMRMAIGLTMMPLRKKDEVTGAFKAPSSSLGKAHPLPEHRRLFTLPDGRLMDYAVFGAAEGRPCVYFHLEYLGDLWPETMAMAAARRGLKIIAPARPYYGRSSPYPKGTVNYEQNSQDMEHLLAHLKVKKAVFVSTTVGGMYLTALWQHKPDLCAGMVAISPAFQPITAKDEKNMPIFIRFMASVVFRHPQLLEHITKLGYAYHSRVGSRKFLKLIHGDIPVDMEIVNNPEYLETIVRGFEFSSVHAHKASFHDYKTIMPNTNDLMLKVDVPFFVIIGDADKNTRVERTDSLIAAGARIQKVVAKDGGSLLKFTHPDLIVDTIAKAWDQQLTGQDVKK
jgi:pimeloyl-ACP methyl ester carboxylesterase/DNA-binding CsgD family transcriptional regulator